MRRLPTRPTLTALEARTLLSTLTLEAEPNETPAQATVLALDPSLGRTRFEGTLSGANDRDLFALTVPGTGPVRVQLERLVAERGAQPLRVAIQSPGRPPRALGGLIGVGATRTFNATGGQTVFIRLRNNSGSENPYAFTLRTTALQEDGRVVLRGNSVNEVERNDTDAEANVINIPSIAPLFLRGRGGNFDLDTFVFRPVRGALLTVTNFATPAQGRILIETYEFPGLLNQSPGFQLLEPGQSLSFTVFRGVQYRMRWVIDSNVIVPYNLRLQLSPPFTVVPPDPSPPTSPAIQGPTLNLG